MLPPRLKHRLIGLLLALSQVFWSAPPAMAQDASQPPDPAATSSADLDLSSSNNSVLVSNQMLSNSTVINVAGTATVIKPGDYVTPAMFMALQQVLSSGNQQVNLDLAGRAVSGLVNLSSISTQISQLVIPTGVSALANSSSSVLNITGILNTQGRLIGLPAGQEQALRIQAEAVYVAPGASITTIVPADILKQISPQAGTVDLWLMSLTNVFNAGSITSSGQVNVIAQGSIVNQLPAGYSGPAATPIIMGMTGTNLYSASGTIVNSGIISSLLGNVTFSTAIGRDLVLNNIGGQVLANAGSIGFFNPSSKQLLEIMGGLLQAQTIELAAGNGHARLSVDELQGLLNVSAGTAQIVSKGGTLNLGALNLTGDPTIANSTGDVVLNSNLVLPGQDLAILASGSIRTAAGVNLIDLSSTAAFPNSGNLHVIAGYDFSQSGETYTIGSPSETGGSVLLGGVQIKTEGASFGNGGNVTILAHDGTASDLPTPGIINIGSISTSSGVGAAGDVKIIGQSGITSGSIQANGAPAGSVELWGSIPNISNVVFNGGTLAAGSTIEAEFPPGDSIFSPDVRVNGQVTADGVGTAAGGEIRLRSTTEVIVTGDLTTIGGTGGDGGLISVFSAEGGIYLDDLVASGGSSDDDGGDGGSIFISPSGFALVGSNVVARGGSSFGGGQAGGGGVVRVNAADVNGRTVGSLQINGFIDVSGGDMTGGSGTSGDGGALFVGGGGFEFFTAVATLRVLGTNNGLSINASPGTACAGCDGGMGSPGDVEIYTNGTQPIPLDFRPTSVTRNIPALPGGMFNVGDGSVNGTAGDISTGSSVATPANAGRVVGEFTIGSIFINTFLSQQTGLLRGTDTVTINVDDGAGNRTLVTPGEALALFQLTRSQTQGVGLDSSGRVEGINNSNDTSNMVIDAFELLRDFTNFDHSVMTENRPFFSGAFRVTIHGRHPIVRLANTTNPLIASNPDQFTTIAFCCEGTRGVIDFGNQPMYIGPFGFVAGLDGAKLELRGSNSDWKNQGILGAFDGSELIINHTGNVTLDLRDPANGSDYGSLVGKTVIEVPNASFNVIGGFGGDYFTTDSYAPSVPSSINIQMKQVSVGNLQAVGDVTLGILELDPEVDFGSISSLTIRSSSNVMAGGTLFMQALGESEIFVQSEAMLTAGTKIQTSSATFSDSGDSIYSAPVIELTTTSPDRDIDFGEGGSIGQISLEIGDDTSFNAVNGISIVSQGSLVVLSGVSIISDGGPIKLEAKGDSSTEEFSPILFIGPGTTIQSGILSGSAPATGALSPSHIESAGSVEILSEPRMELSSFTDEPTTVTSIGGNLSLVSTNGRIVLDLLLCEVGCDGEEGGTPGGLTLQAIGGNLLVLAGGSITSDGINNFYISRAVGTPLSFTGGGIQFSAGDSEDPENLSEYFLNPSSAFISPATTDLGDNVSFVNNGIDSGLIQLNGGDVDVSDSTLTVRGGAIIFDTGGERSISFSGAGANFIVEAFNPLTPGTVTVSVSEPAVSELPIPDGFDPSTVAPGSPVVLPNEKTPPSPVPSGVQPLSAVQIIEQNTAGVFVACATCSGYGIVEMPGTYVQGQTGTTFEVSEEKTILLRDGRMLLAAGKDGLRVQIGKKILELKEDTIGIVDAREDKPTRLTILDAKSNDAAVIKVNGEKLVALNAGQDALLADQALVEEELIAVDGVEREPVGGVIQKAGYRVQKASVDVQKVLQSEPLLTCCFGMRKASGKNSSLCSSIWAFKQLKDRYPNASQESIVERENDKEAQRGQRPTSMRFDDGTRPMWLTPSTPSGRYQWRADGDLQFVALMVPSVAPPPVASEIRLQSGSKLDRLAADHYLMTAGTAIIQPIHSLRFDTPHASIFAKSGSTVVVSSDTEITRVLDIADTWAADVRVQVGKRILNLGPGREAVVLPAGHSDPLDLVSADQLGRRKMRIVPINDKHQVAMDEFSLVNALFSVPLLKDMRSSQVERDRKLYGTILKTAAAVTVSVRTGIPFSSTPSRSVAQSEKD